MMPVGSRPYDTTGFSSSAFCYLPYLFVLTHFVEYHTLHFNRVSLDAEYREHPTNSWSMPPWFCCRQWKI